MLYGYSEDGKYEIIDDGFYKFMKFCVKSIPKNSDVCFFVYPKEPLLYSPDWYLKEYYVQKCPYYLFPRRIFSSECSKNQDIDYRIIYDPRFRYLYLYYKDKLIPYATN